MINEKLHLLLLLALNKGIVHDDKITLSSKHLNKSVSLSTCDIQSLCRWYVDSEYSEGIINQFNRVVYDWDRGYFPNESEEESMLTISNIYRRYLEQVQIDGSKYETEYYFKLYSPNRIEITSGELRGEFGRTWIDYESKLKESDIISDDIGVWACSENWLLEMIHSVGAREHYGNNIMILKMLPNEKYLNQSNQEYIGNSYKVVYKQPLRSLDDYIKLKDYISSITPVKFGYKAVIDYIERMVTHVNFNKDFYDINNIDVRKLMI